MTTPEDALEQARASLESMRADGGYDPEESRAGSYDVRSVAEGKLSEWALIEPDVARVRSTRRYGAPITALKRGLLWLLRQYHAELLGEQTRFNATLLEYVRRLERRVEELERSAARDEHGR
jgi:hypothetical protein